MAYDNFQVNNFDPLHHVEGLTKLNSSIERSKDKKENKRKKKQKKEDNNSAYYHDTETDEIEFIDNDDTPDDEGEHIDFRA